ncbi:MAG: helix-turn-helix domain-containing protein [Alphaproteobacteria bacterium]
MIVRTPSDLGAVIRDRRKQLKLDQAGLALKIGVSRQWLIGVERGRARAELGLVLRALDALGIKLSTEIITSPRKRSEGPDIDIIVSAARKGGRR